MATESTPTLGVNEQFFRYFHDENTKILQQLSNLENLSSVGGEQQNGIEHCRYRITNLRKRIQDVSPHVPPHDRKIYNDVRPCCCAKKR